MASVDVTTVSLAISRKSKFIHAKRLLVADSNLEERKKEKEAEKKRGLYSFRNRLLVFSKL